MNRVFLDNRLAEIGNKLADGQRLDYEDGMTLFNSHDLIGIGRLADRIRRKRYQDQAFYIVNQHLNYTNVCLNRCRFCAFARDEGESNAFTLSLDEVKARMKNTPSTSLQEIHIVGGVNSELPFGYYLDLLKVVKAVHPQATLKAFTAVEIDYLAQLAGLSLIDTIEALKDAGWGMMPGGGAEVLSKRIQRELFPRKIDNKRWLEVVEAVHGAGIVSNATMLYGHIEQIEERVEHLIQLRTLQDRTGGFSAFIPLAFHAENTELSHIPPTTGFDDLKTIAISRLMLDNFDHIKAYWVMLGEKTAQVALSFGADDLDGTIVEEKISHMAGAKSAPGLTQPQMERMICAAGFKPVARDSFYRAVNRAQEDMTLKESLNDRA